MLGDSETVEPTLRNRHHQRLDQAGQVFLQKTEKLEKISQARKSQEERDKKQPPGGFDATPFPPAPPGYTLKFTFHRAHHLPFADISTLSSDPYVIATLKTNLPKRHKDDPDLRFRTPTIHRNTEPEWNAEWVVGHVPASGFFLKCRIYDEDPADHDDRLGNVHVSVNGIGDSWPGIKAQTFEVKMRMGSKRAYLVRGCATMFSGSLKLRGDMVVSVENLGKTPGESGSKAYTIGPLQWSRHFSPLIGRLTGTTDPDEETDQDNKKKTQKYKSAIFSNILTIWCSIC
jgi:C2 domain